MVIACSRSRHHLRSAQKFLMSSMMLARDSATLVQVKDERGTVSSRIVLTRNTAILKSKVLEYEIGVA